MRSPQIIFKHSGYETDGGNLSYTDVYNLAFDNTTLDDAGLPYLARIARLVVDNARKSPDISLTRTAPVADSEQLFELLRELPYVLGAKFVKLAGG